MIVYRLCRAAHRALDGEGAFLVGGRWNRPGRRAVYGSEHLSLAALEYLAHLEVAQAPPDLIAIRIRVPDDGVVSLDPNELPADWYRQTEHPWCMDYGDRWIDRDLSVGLAVPSAIVPEERNLLLNPRHAAFTEVRVLGERPFRFDPRLLP